MIKQNLILFRINLKIRFLCHRIITVIRPSRIRFFTSVRVPTPESARNLSRRIIRLPAAEMQQGNPILLR